MPEARRKFMNTLRTFGTCGFVLVVKVVLCGAATLSFGEPPTATLAPHGAFVLRYGGVPIFAGDSLLLMDSQ